MEYSAFKFVLVLVWLTAYVGALTCDFPSEMKWNASRALATPKVPGWVAFKDFTHARINNTDLVYATYVNSNQSNGPTMGTMAFDTFSGWSNMENASQSKMTAPGVAPTLFWFSPKSVWVLCYQWGGSTFSYRTSTDPHDANAWSSPMPLFSGNIADSPVGPVHQTIIGNGDRMFMYFAGDNGKIYSSNMSVKDFPGTFGTASEVVFTDESYNVFEGVQVYSIKDQPKYLMIVEAIGVTGRYFRSYLSDALGTPWSPQFVNESMPFAGSNNSGAFWTADVSSGDLIRSSNDYTMPIDLCNLQFLCSGRLYDQPGQYLTLPWQPVLLNLTNAVVKN